MRHLGGFPSIAVDSEDGGVLAAFEAALAELKEPHPAIEDPDIVLAEVGAAPRDRCLAVHELGRALEHENPFVLVLVAPGIDRRALAL